MKYEKFIDRIKGNKQPTYIEDVGSWHHIRELPTNISVLNAKPSFDDAVLKDIFNIKEIKPEDVFDYRTHAFADYLEHKNRTYHKNYLKARENNITLPDEDDELNESILINIYLHENYDLHHASMRPILSVNVGNCKSRTTGSVSMFDGIDGHLILPELIGLHFLTLQQLIPNLVYQVYVKTEEIRVKKEYHDINLEKKYQCDDIRLKWTRIKRVVSGQHKNFKIDSEDKNE